MSAAPPRDLSWPSLDELLGDIRAVLQRSEDIVCLAHKDADADSLGSALAFAAALRAMGKRPHPMVPEPEPFLLSYLPGYDTLERAPEHIDAVFTFDCATLGRFGECRSLLEGDLPVVNVDHHVSNDAYGTINLIEPEASATGQVVYRLLRALDAPISADAANNLYAAVLTDTGGFRHENTNEAALRLAADLVALGADPAWVALKSFKSRPASQLKLVALAVAAMRSELDGRLVWTEVTESMLQQAQARTQETDGIIDELQTVDTMKIAILFKQLAPARTKISVRSRDEVDATAICRPFGGGGHRRAAGAELALALADAEEAVLAVARRELGAA
jgi:phosphoesterase RecJ-like protein